MRPRYTRGLTAAAAVTLVAGIGIAVATNAGAAEAPPASPTAKVDNPYAGAKGYVNPEWKEKAEPVSGGSAVPNTPTAVWLDRIAAIAGTADSSSNGAMGLADHLDAAISQGVGYIQLVIYDLPGRDCAALASNGELGPDEIGRYQTEYIDPIAAIEADAKYASLRIINVIEIDSLPNLVTNTGSAAGATAACDTMKSNGNYVQGVGYALKKLGAVANTYNYVDAAHHGWIGWDSNFAPTAQIMLQAAQASGSVDNVTGFITNTANYSALNETVPQGHLHGRRHQRPPVEVGRLEPVRRRALVRRRRSGPSWSRSASTPTSAC